MARFIVYKWHNGSSGVLAINPKDSPAKIIELGQRNQKKCGRSNGITWQLYEGDFVGAMVATTKI